MSHPGRVLTARDVGTRSGRTSPDPHTLAERQRAWLRSVFAGRAQELALFDRALEGEPRVLYLYGPPGIGKSALLRVFEDRARARGVTSRLVDLSRGPVREADLTTPPARLLLLDAFERAGALEPWTREVFLPELLAEATLVIASRAPPSTEWRQMAGWRTVVEARKLGPLSEHEAKQVLAARAVPREAHEAIIAQSHGYPLALTLAADQATDGELAAHDASVRLAKALVERITEGCDPEQRAALEAASLLRHVTEPLLAAMLGVEDAHEAFVWLSSQSFVDLPREGLAVHAFAREAIDAELVWRNRERHALLRDRAHAWYNAKLRAAPRRAWRELAHDMFFLHRKNEVLGAVFEGLRELREDRPTAQDVAAAGAAIARHQGAEARAIFERWYARQPEGLELIRGEGGVPSGLLFTLRLDRADPAEIAGDPGTAAAWRHAARHGPLRPGEAVNLSRFWLSFEDHQAITPVTSSIGSLLMRRHFTTPRLAFSYWPIESRAEPLWAAGNTYAGVCRFAAADFHLGAHAFTTWGMDFRRLAPGDWLTALATRVDGADAPAPDSQPAPAVLTHEQFEDAVREALRNLGTRALDASPLQHTRLIRDRAGPGATPAARSREIATAITDAIFAVGKQRRGERAERALDQVYVRRAESQQAAADALGLPFSTFRRHLAAGVEQVIHLLWTQETGSS